MAENVKLYRLIQIIIAPTKNIIAGTIFGPYIQPLLILPGSTVAHSSFIIKEPTIEKNGRTSVSDWLRIILDR